MELLQSNGAKLEMHVPQTGAPVLAVVPFEHYSHLGWGALKEETRLYLLKGLADVHTAAAFLLGRELPRIDRLLTLVVAVPVRKFYNDGAYCEAVMKSKLAWYIEALGDEAGTKAWQEWYKGRKQHAGEIDRYIYTFIYIYIER